MNYNQRMRLYMQERHKKQREKSIAYLGGKCVDCNSTNNLEFDHIDPKTKSFTISSKFTWAWEKLIPELNKCELLCLPCHKNRTIKQNTVEHGQGKTGKRNCYCDLCKPLKRLFMKQYRGQSMDGYAPDS